MATDHYAHELAKTVLGLFSDGILDPSCEEIARAHWGDKAIPDEMIAGVRRRLKRIKVLLMREHNDTETVLVNYKWYKEHDRCPESESDARACMAIGTNRAAHGICCVVDGNDAIALIYGVTHTRHASAASGKLKRQIDGACAAYDRGVIDLKQLGRMHLEAKARAAPDRRKLIQRAICASQDTRSIGQLDE